MSGRTLGARWTIALAVAVTLSPALAGGGLATENVETSVSERLCQAASLSVDGGCERWKASFNGIDDLDDTANDVAVNPAHDQVVVAGATAHAANPGGPPPTSTHALVVAYEATSGEEQWAATVPGAGSGPDELRTVTVTPDGQTVLAAGYTEPSIDGDDRHLFTLALDAEDGTLLWSRVLPSSLGDVAEATDLAIGPEDDRAFVVGTSEEASFWHCHTWNADREKCYETHRHVHPAAVVHAFDIDEGSRDWASTYTVGGLSDTGDATARHDVSAVAVNEDRRELYITGDARTRNCWRAYQGACVGYGWNQVAAATWAIDVDNGAEQWTHRGPAGTNADVAVATSGELAYTVGTSNAGGDASLRTAALKASTGQEVWTDAHDRASSTEDRGVALAVDPTGGTVTALGASTWSNAPTDTTVRALNATHGAEAWTTVRDADGDHDPQDLAATPLGERVVLIEDRVDTEGDAFVATAALDASTGETAWAREAGGSDGAGAHASALAVAPGGVVAPPLAPSVWLHTDYPKQISVEATVPPQQTPPVAQIHHVFAAGADAHPITGEDAWALSYDGGVPDEDRVLDRVPQR